jgi:predicted cupin superfamily sugar epimerase
MTPALLDLQPHPEGGHYRETWRAAGTVPTPYGDRSPATAILFLLQPGESSRWHRVRSAELWLWLWQGGGELLLELGGTGRAPALEGTVNVGPGPEDLQRLVQPGQWQAARPAGGEAVLVACVVAPGFDFTDLELEEA